MGVYDLPAAVDWILGETGHKRVFYIGHSMGTTMFYVMASTRPEYNQKIQLMVSLAPVAFVGHVKSPIRLLVPFTKDLEVRPSSLALQHGSSLCFCKYPLHMYIILRTIDS
jgi:alpha/beta hydrolase fold.